MFVKIFLIANISQNYLRICFLYKIFVRNSSTFQRYLNTKVDPLENSQFLAISVLLITYRDAQRGWSVLSKRHCIFKYKIISDIIDITPF